MIQFNKIIFLHLNYINNVTANCRFEISRLHIRVADSLHVANIVGPGEMRTLRIGEAEATAKVSGATLIPDVGAVEVTVHCPLNFTVVTVVYTYQ